MPQPAPQNRKSRIALLGLIAVLALCGFQYGDKLGLNGLPFAQVRPLVGDLSKAERMAKQGNIDFFAGQPVAGTPLTLHGELTDANCFLATQTHAYDHAFCAKLCTAAGSPLLYPPTKAELPTLSLRHETVCPCPKNCWIGSVFLESS